MKPARALDRRLSTSSDQPGVASTTCIRRLPDGANSGECYQSTTAISELPTMPLSDHRLRALAPGEQEGPPGVHPRVHGRTARRGRPLAQLVSAPAAPPSTRRRPVTNGPMKSVLLLTQLRTAPAPAPRRTLPASPSSRSWSCRHRHGPRRTACAARCPAASTRLRESAQPIRRRAAPHAPAASPAAAPTCWRSRGRRTPSRRPTSRLGVW
jgi:hypothetical protein